MRLQISGSIPTRFHDEIRQLIALGFRGTSDAGVEVHVRASGSGEYLGYTYWGVPTPSRVARTTRQLVTIRIPRDPTRRTYPHTWSYPGLKTAPKVTFASWQEELLHLSAHEANHVRQHRNGRSRSEIRCERWALKQLDRYRRENLSDLEIVELIAATVADILQG